MTWWLETDFRSLKMIRVFCVRDLSLQFTIMNIKHHQTVKLSNSKLSKWLTRLTYQLDLACFFRSSTVSIDSSCFCNYLQKLRKKPRKYISHLGFISAATKKWPNIIVKWLSWNITHLSIIVVAIIYCYYHFYCILLLLSFLLVVLLSFLLVV
jgi:hypothetical protein